MRDSVLNSIADTKHALSGGRRAEYGWNVRGGGRWTERTMEKRKIKRRSRCRQRPTFKQITRHRYEREEFFIHLFFANPKTSLRS